MALSVRQDERTDFFTSAGQSVRFRVRGDGPPLLMIHGIGAPFEMWRPLDRHLGGFTTIVVDPPGAGKSTMPDGRFRMSDFAGVLDDLLSHLRFASASVLGLSLGGMMAQELAHRSPERVDRLVLASTGCGWNADPQTSTLFATPSRRRARRRDARAGVQRPRSQQELSFVQLQWELRQTYRPSVRGLKLGLVAAFTWSSRSWLHTLDMPVMVLHGTDDAVLPVANARIIAATVPDGRLEVYQDAGHLAVLQQPARTAGLLCDFARTT
jgi:pimeloyl-ACP methyl ester carboxylesterase